MLTLRHSAGVVGMMERVPGGETGSVMLAPAALQAWIARILGVNGAGVEAAGAVAAVVAAAERDGAHSHGVFRMPGYVSSLRVGWVDGGAVAEVTEAAPGLLAVDARNGFAQPALASARGRLIEMARAQGVAVAAIRNSHHFAALWPDVEPLAEAGLVAIAMCNSRSLVVPFGGRTALFGTNPMAFACPREGGAPLIWDQASSVIAHGDVMIARREGRSVPAGTGVDSEGVATTDPDRILEGGALSTFAGHKGSSVALMVELLAAALTGGAFGFEDRSGDVEGAATSSGGEFVLAIDPARLGPGFGARVEALLGEIVGNGAARLPGVSRLENRARSLREGVALRAADFDMLCGLAPGVVP